MGRGPIPEFKAWMASYADDDGVGPPEWIVEERERIRKALYTRKREYTKWIREGILEKSVVKVYPIGPINFPIEWFVSSRWCERRNYVPLARDEESWRFSWEYWKGAGSYRDIKGNIEKHGMRRAIYAFYYVNYDVEANKLQHPCFAYHLENLEWPMFIASTGNERIPMAWFEWGWKTVPTMVMVRDCGHSPEFSALLKGFIDGFIHKHWKPNLEVLRTIDERGEV